MAHEIIGGECPSCGPTRIYVISEALDVPFPCTGTLIGLYGLCYGCLGFLTTSVATREKFEQATWFLDDEEKIEYIFSPRTLDELRAEAFGPHEVEPGADDIQAREPSPEEQVVYSEDYEG